MIENKKSFVFMQTCLHVIFIMACISFVIPLMILVSSSLTSDQAIRDLGYPIIPKLIDLTAYKIIFRNPQKMVTAYEVTAFISVVGSLLSVIVMGLIAYPLSRRDFAYRKGITQYIFLTMLFSGGLIPGYILTTQYLHMNDNILVYIIPSLASAWYIIIMRTFFQALPISLIESAKMDGAKELYILMRIIAPLSKPVIATIGLFCLLGKWNEWYMTLLYIRNEKLFTLQYLLQRVLNEVQFLKEYASQMNIYTANMKPPTLSMRYALTVVAAGPMLIIFPFFQKYFTKGLTIGAVKG
ncbi:MAG: carbohydrate ABC transporter permease [Ruminiclostridium sp.]|nr:carbohydrate ABC transporter permease [Ruminiclostridium sp.]